MKLGSSRAMDTKRPRGSRGANHATNCNCPDAGSHLTLGRLSKRSRVSQNRAALHAPAEMSVVNFCCRLSQGTTSIWIFVPGLAASKAFAASSK